MPDHAIPLGRLPLGQTASLEVLGPADLGDGLDLAAIAAEVFEDSAYERIQGQVRLVLAMDVASAPPAAASKTQTVTLSPLPRVETGARLSGTNTLSGECRIEAGAILVDANLKDCWVAGEVRRSMLHGVLVGPDETLVDQALDTLCQRLAPLLAHPEAPISGAYQHVELSPEDREGILRYYLENPGGVRALLEPLRGDSEWEAEVDGDGEGGDSETFDAAFARVHRLCRHPIFERLSSESLYAYVFGLVRRGLADAPGGSTSQSGSDISPNSYRRAAADPYAAFKARFRPSLQTHVAHRLAALEADLDAALALALDSAASETAIQALLTTLATEVTQANLFDGQSESAAAVFGRPGFFEDVAGGLEASVTRDFAIDHRSALATLLLDGLQREGKGFEANDDQDHRPGPIVYFTDNYEEAWIDATLWALLTALGHQVLVVGKALPARGDATEADLREIVDDIARSSPRFAASFKHRLRITHNGAGTYGSPPERLPEALIKAMRSASLIVLKGQANTYTTVARNALVIDAPIGLSMLVKGITAERVSGISRAGADRRHRPLLALIDRGATPLRTWDADEGFGGSLLEQLTEGKTTMHASV